MKRKFTQEELQQAYQQMIGECQAEYNNAVNAARELEGIVGKTSSCKVYPPSAAITPVPFVDYWLLLRVNKESYKDFYNNQRIKKLTDVVPGRPPRHPHNFSS